MSPDLTPRRFPWKTRPVRPEPNIPQFQAVETTERRDKQVNMQLGAFVAFPVAGIVLIFRPSAAEAVLAGLLLVLGATRHSWLQYRCYRHLRAV
ncbi:hypothetical protein [Streptomyces flavidovirens]